jgi:hypothetical protein
MSKLPLIQGAVIYTNCTGYFTVKGTFNSQNQQLTMTDLPPAFFGRGRARATSIIITQPNSQANIIDANNIAVAILLLPPHFFCVHTIVNSSTPR